MSDLVAQGDGWHVRLATKDDNDALLRLMREVPMSGAVALAQDRAPDFFASNRLHESALVETGIAIDEASGEAVGCGTYVMRDAWWFDGARRRVGYLSDLRVRPSHRGARIVPTWGKGAFERARDRNATEVFVTSFVAKNWQMQGVAARQGEQPVSLRMTPYSMLNVQVAGPLPRVRGDIRRAQPADLDELARFLAEGQRTRAFGYVIDRKLIETRLATWHGLRIEDFRLAFDRRGAIVGCCAPWEATRVRRTIVEGWRGGLAAYRAAFNAAAPLLRAERLPGRGEPLRFATLSHLEVAGDDPAVLRDLVASCLADARERRLHFLGAMVVDGSPLERAFRGLLASRTRLVMNATMLPTSEWRRHDFSTSRPGFEMALA